MRPADPFVGPRAAQLSQGESSLGYLACPFQCQHKTHHHHRHYLKTLEAQQLHPPTCPTPTSCLNTTPQDSEQPFRHK